MFHIFPKVRFGEIAITFTQKRYWRWYTVTLVMKMVECNDWMQSAFSSKTLGCQICIGRSSDHDLYFTRCIYTPKIKPQTMVPTLFQIQNSSTFQGILNIFQGPFFVKNCNFGSFYYSFYQISHHAYQWNTNIVENIKCWPTLFIIFVFWF